MLTTILLAAEEGAESAQTVPAWAVGVIVFGFLMFLLLAVVAFGRGREHC